MINNSTPIGFAVGCTCQFGFLMVGGAIASFASITDSRIIPFQAREVLLLSWGVTQWIALVPLIRSQRALGHTKTVRGMIISGCLGVVFSAICTVMLMAVTGPDM
jgi:hypothetical protein